MLEHLSLKAVKSVGLCSVMILTWQGPGIVKMGHPLKQGAGLTGEWGTLPKDEGRKRSCRFLAQYQALCKS